MKARHRKSTAIFISSFLILAIAALSYALEPRKEPMIRVESGMHTATVTAMATDANNRYLVTASIDKTVRLWDVSSGKLIRVFRPPLEDGDEGKLYAVAISPDGQTIACGGTTGQSWGIGAIYPFSIGGVCSGGFITYNDSNIYLFDVSTGHLKKMILTPPRIISSLSYSNDGHYLFAVIEDTQGYCPRATYHGPRSEINLFEVYRTSDYSRIFTIGDESYGFYQHSFLERKSDDRVTVNFISISKNAEVILVEMTTDERFPRFKAIAKLHSGTRPYSVQLAPDGSLIAISYRDSQKIDVYSAKDLSYLYSPDTTGIGKGSLMYLSWSPDGRFLYAAGTCQINSTYIIRKWHDAGKGINEDISVSTTPITHFLSLKDGRIVFASDEPSLSIIDQAGNRIVHQRSVIASFRVENAELLVSKDGTTVQFDYDDNGKTHSRFSINKRSHFQTDAPEESTAALQKPIHSAAGIAVKDWQNSKQPKIQALDFSGNRPQLKDKELSISSGEISHHLAIAPDQSALILGTTSYLRMYDNLGNLKWKVKAPEEICALNISGDSRIAVAAFADGIIRWYRVKDGEQLFSLFPHRDKKQRAIWTASGHYDVTEGADELIGWHINQGKDKEALFIGLNTLYDVFYRPDIVQAKARGEDTRGLVTLTVEQAMQNPPPIVNLTINSFTTDQSNVRVCYQVKSTGGGIGEVRLFHNGKLIQSDGYYRELTKSTAEKTQLAALNGRAIHEDMRSLIIKEKTEVHQATTKPKGEVFEDCKEVEAVPGENEISVAAFNGNNTVQSYLKTVNFNSSVKSEDSHLYILSIGIDQYKDNTVNLRYAVKDSEYLKNKLRAQSATLYKPQNIHYTLLTDREATKTDITGKINELSKIIKPNDSFILFVAGHGALLQNQYYMLTHDYDGRVNDNSMISSNEIMEMSKKIKSLSQLFIFDTCHAGGVDYIVSGLYDARMSVLAKNMGLHIYASANDKQAAMDGYKGNGLFTYVLLDGLNNNKEADKNKDGNVTIVGLGEYSKKMTTNISKEIGRTQTPLIINFGKDSPIYKLQ